jgi:hypothetical protein
MPGAALAGADVDDVWVGVADRVIALDRATELTRR